MPESEGAVPLGHCLPGLGDSALSPGNGGELGKCAGLRPGWAVHPATGGASGEARGQRAGARVSHETGLRLTLRLLCSDPSCSINACFFLLLSRPFSYSVGGKSIFCVEVY